jgi:tripartite-type tricarboxylate transporter receptor subunit TctC
MTAGGSFGFGGRRAGVRQAEANPGRLTYAAAGTGSASRLVGEPFARRTGARPVHVPYRGDQPALNDPIGGQVDLKFGDIPGTLSSMGNGGLRIPALAGRHRPPLAPDVPTFAERGVSGLEAGTWMGIMAPKGVPGPVVEKLATATAGMLRKPDTLAGLRTLGADPAYASRGEFATRMAGEVAQWLRVVREADSRVG